MSFPLLCSLLCTSLFPDTNKLNIYIGLNGSGDAASRWSKDFWHSGVTSLDITRDRPIVKGYYIPISINDQAILVWPTGPVFYVHSENNTSWKLAKTSLV